MKHVILRDTRAVEGRESTSLPRAEADVGGGLELSVEDLAPRDVPDLRRDRSLVVAPVMPMKLIAPVETQDAAPAAAAATWGVRAVGADSSPFSGDGAVVAVLDTGIDKTHAAFAVAGLEIFEQDFTGEGNGDRQGHGTHCAGTIFGRNVGNTRIGVAPGVKRALIGKVLDRNGSGSTEQIVEGIRWAVDSGANIISMSLGMDFPGYQRSLVEEQGVPQEAATSLALEGYRANVLLFERLASLIRAQQLLSGQPTIIIAAAGNESDRPRYEIAVSPPAVAEGLIAVAALGQEGDRLSVAPFSNTAANVSGPGVGIISAKVGGGLRSSSGTSMAAPHVAGVAALWVEQIMRSGGLFNAQILTGRLIASATSEGLAAGLDPVDIGAGLVRAPR